MTSISHYPHSLKTKYYAVLLYRNGHLFLLYVEDINVLKLLLCVGIKNMMVPKNL